MAMFLSILLRLEGRPDIAYCEKQRTRSGTESLPKVFLHDNCEQISFIIFFAFLNKEEMRSGTHFTQQKVFLLFTVVVTKLWQYFQSRFPKSSSERVSSCYLPKFFFFTERAGPTRGRNSSTYWLAEIWGGWPIERERIF